MATDKTYTVAGVSTLNGKTKIRWANDPMRIKQLIKKGHTDIELITLPDAMTKSEIVTMLIDSGFGQGRAEVGAALDYCRKKYPVPHAEDQKEMA